MVATKERCGTKKPAWLKTVAAINERRRIRIQMLYLVNVVIMQYKNTSKSHWQYHLISKSTEVLSCKCRHFSVVTSQRGADFNYFIY